MSGYKWFWGGSQQDLYRHTGRERQVLPHMYLSAATVTHSVLKISLEDKENGTKGPNWTSESNTSELTLAIYKFMRT